MGKEERAKNFNIEEKPYTEFFALVPSLPNTRCELGKVTFPLGPSRV